MASKRPRLYQTWCNMKTRCYNPKSLDYKNYGGRGINVCDDWFTSYKQFESDMLPSYQEGLTLERINVDGDYSINNCRWATRLEQSLNTRRNNPITFLGVTKSLGEWADDIGVKRSTLRQRYYGYGWGIERCLTKTVGNRG